MEIQFSCTVFFFPVVDILLSRFLHCLIKADDVIWVFSVRTLNLYFNPMKMFRWIVESLSCSFSKRGCLCSSAFVFSLREALPLNKLWSLSISALLWFLKWDHFRNIFMFKDYSSYYQVIFLQTNSRSLLPFSVIPLYLPVLWFVFASFVAWKSSCTKLEVFFIAACELV